MANRIEQSETIDDSFEDRLAAIERRLAADFPVRSGQESARPETAESGAVKSEPAEAEGVAPDAAVQELDKRLSQRIARLESEVAGQAGAIAGHSQAIAELRACSLRNEESVRRLLGGIERLIDSQTLPHSAPLRTVKPTGSSAA